MTYSVYVSVEHERNALQKQSLDAAAARTCKLAASNGQVQEEGREEGLRRLGGRIVRIHDIVGPVVRAY